MVKLGAAVGLAVLLATSSASAEEPARIGVGLLAFGGVSLVVGAANLAAAAACAVRPMPTADDLAWRSGCMARQIGIGLAFAAVSVPLFAVGGARLAAEGQRVGVAVLPGGAALLWRARF